MPGVPAPASGHWRPMTAADLPMVKALADAIHAAYPESGIVFAERLALHGDGCLVLQGPGGIAGYVLSHPWRMREPPALDVRLGALPERATTYYIHDLALQPSVRGSGAATAAVARLAARARALQLPNMTLVAVGNSVHFWRRQGFVAVADPALAGKLASYGGHATYMSRPLPPAIQRQDVRDET